jgi:transcriptional regulator with XRE-family HTH domain/tetratricopeptide (TPR) repeat protein
MNRDSPRPGSANHSFGYWLRRRRKALDLTQEALARLVSCSRDAIRKIEADERRPSRGLAERLADKLVVPAEERQAFVDAARRARRAECLAIDDSPLVNASGTAGSVGAAGEHGGVDASGAEPEATPVVGRDYELGQLRGLLARLAAGGGHVVLVEGEPGIGKSRLVGELARYARGHGIPTLATRCYEIERAMPYQPVIDLVVQGLALAPQAALETLPPVSLAEIAALVPTLRQQTEVPALSQDFPEARQARLFRAIEQLFDALAAGRQLVVIADDIHWADDASARFLHFFAREAALKARLVLIAYRAEELAGDERLAALVDSLRREPHARRLPLARLGLAETQALLGGDLALAERLHRETDGNPFFLTSMLHALHAGEISVDAPGDLPLPEALTAAVRTRLAHVPEGARHALDVAAVLGGKFDFESLLAVTKDPEPALLEALETLIGRRLLHEAADGTYDFSHDKLREVAYREISGARRKILHRTAAEALEASDAVHRTAAEALEASGASAWPERDARLAEHYERAQVWDKALHHAWLAAERSQRLFALGDALRWLDRAEALAAVRPDALGARKLADLYAWRGRVRAQAGQTAGAVADIRRVMADAEARADRTAARDALIQLGMTYRRGDDYDRANACLTKALAECRAMRDERAAADTLYHLGTVAWSNHRNGEAIAHHGEAVAVCERLGLANLVAVQAYHGSGEARFNNLEPREAIACYERSIELARAIGDKSYESENLMMIGFANVGVMGLGDYAAAEGKFAAALEIADRADLQWHRGPILLGRDNVGACKGAYGEAFSGMVRTLQWLEGLGQIRYQIMACVFLAQLLIDLGLYTAALEYSDRALALAAESKITFWRGQVRAMHALARLRLGDLDIGPELEREAVHCEARCERMQMLQCRRVLAQLALARGEPAVCLSLAQTLHETARVSGLEEVAATAEHLRGEALLAQGRTEAAAEALAAARRGARRIGRARLILDIERATARLGEEAEADRWSALIERSLEGTSLRAAL